MLYQKGFQHVEAFQVDVANESEMNEKDMKRSLKRHTLLRLLMERKLGRNPTV
ncbi:hypothetical protein ACFOU2_10380 [Bacillus songklensis]|uniref:Uncharacterized protein n=1 Tax=Bacillus songklensis TaxID=1069116 RepID=A0ABV8B401_9BACI